MLSNKELSFFNYILMGAAGFFLSLCVILYLSDSKTRGELERAETEIFELKEKLHLFESYYGIPIHDIRKTYVKQDLRYLVNHELLQTPLQLDPAEFHSLKEMIENDLDIERFLRGTAYKFQQCPTKFYCSKQYQLILMISMTK